MVCCRVAALACVHRLDCESALSHLWLFGQGMLNTREMPQEEGGWVETGAVFIVFYCKDNDNNT